MTKTQHQYNAGTGEWACKSGYITKENSEPEITILHNMHFDYKCRLMAGKESLKSKIMKKILKIKNLLIG